MSKKITLQDIVQAIKDLSKNLAKPIDKVSLRDLSEHGIAERQVRKHGGLSKIRNVYFPLDDKDLKTISELKHTSSYTSKLEKQIGERLILETQLEEAIKNIPKIKISQYKPKKKQKINRELTLVLSDLHIGSDIKKEETGLIDFGKTEESRRLAKIIKETIDYKEHYREQTEINVLIIGDIIENRLHDPTVGAPVAEQSARAIYLLTQALAQLSASFPKVKVMFCTGNHGRNTGRHHNRATNQKWDSIESIIYYAIKNSLRDNTNIQFNFPLTPYGVYSVFGKKIFVTHGDTVLNLGYPGSNINTKSLETQINKINASLPDQDEYSVFIGGHVHIGSMVYLSNGATVITNGPLVPANEYAVSIGLMESVCGQYLFESVPGYAVGDSRYIRVTVDDDKNKELDKIITPWEKF